MEYFLALSLKLYYGKARHFQECLHIQNLPPWYKVLLETMPSFNHKIKFSAQNRLKSAVLSALGYMIHDALESPAPDVLSLKSTEKCRKFSVQCNGMASFVHLSHHPSTNKYIFTCKVSSLLLSTHHIKFTNQNGNFGHT